MKVNPEGSMGSFGLLLLRVGIGSLLLFGHGLPKLLHFSDRAASFANPIGVGPAASLTLVVFAEVVCSSLVILGLATRLAAVPPVIFFLIAFFIQHSDDPWNKKELALVYLVPFLALMFTGGGRFSLDALRAQRRGSSG